MVGAMNKPKVYFTACNSGGLVGVLDFETGKVEHLVGGPHTGMDWHKGKLLVVQQIGAATYVRDAITGAKVEFNDQKWLPGNPHDLRLINGFVYIVSTTQNVARGFVFYRDKLGFSHDITPFPDLIMGDDAIHLNSIHAYKGGILMSCFGRFEAKEGWRAFEEEPTGMILWSYGKDTHEILIDLYQPHSLLPQPDGLYFCNSGASTVAHYADSRELAEYKFERYVRGLARMDGGWVVGESCLREEGKDGEDACLVWADDNFNVLERIPIPGVLEIYGVLPYAD